MDENSISAEIVDAAVHIHRKVGPGLFESVYEALLVHELSKRGLMAVRQVPVRLTYDEVVFEEAYRVDVMVNDLVLVELKSIEVLAPVHRKQMLTYLKLTGCRLGLLLNFGATLMRNGIERVVNQLRI